ncbi:MAG: diguanylate cyclase, partial [Lachnospiraceae bacterium]|nr:diguanylate cyclase [Lachnospiraceae bacterium]
MVLPRKETRNILYLLSGITMNVIAAYIARRIGLPIYLDTIGTVFVAASMGLFPGIVAAVATNTLCLLFNPDAIYFSIVNVMIAAYATWFGSRYSFRKYGKTVRFCLGCGLISGAASALIQWNVLGGPQNAAVADLMETITAFPRLPVFLILNIILNIFDKGVSVGIALLAFSFIPDEKLNSIMSFGWKQRPLTDEQIKAIRKHGTDGRSSIRTRMSLIIVGVSFILVVIMGVISTHLYFENVKEEKKQAAVSAARFAAQLIDGDRVSEYIVSGRDIRNYNETEKILYGILDSTPDVGYIFAIKFEKEGAYSVFDIYKGEETVYNPGDRVEIEEDFEPYMKEILAGREVDTVEWSDFKQWTLTALYPVRNKDGKTVCYAGADASLDYMAVHMRDFVIKVVLTLSGFFVLAIAFGLWTTSVYTVYPIGSITACIDGFAGSDDAQARLDENVKLIRALDIHTGDEVERLYQAICNMTLEQAEKMRQIRHFSEETSKMQ